MTTGCQRFCRQPGPQHVMAMACGVRAVVGIPYMWLHTLNPAMDACALALRLTAAVHALPELHRWNDPVLDMLVVSSMLPS